MISIAAHCASIGRFSGKFEQEIPILMISIEANLASIVRFPGKASYVTLKQYRYAFCWQNSYFLLSFDVNKILIGVLIILKLS